MRPPTWLLPVPLAAALAILGCGRTRDDRVTLPEPLLQDLGATVRTVHLTRDQAKQIGQIRITGAWPGAPAGGLFQRAVAPDAQTLYVAALPLAGTQMKVVVASRTEGGNDWVSASGTFPLPPGAGEPTFTTTGGPLEVRPDQPQPLLAGSRPAGTPADGTLNLSVTLVSRTPGH
ncbi:hypothetical protein [Mesoterricola sediminis]|uniref:Lipoprotein n=1 Tax=Mesoterricola sediminis TaxID=2927980 RepID=A0AA48H1G1_9BACT|nr:hypothetical protein [Mesoterricola sediminis]BDU75736.1 hypothetical protein METESE_06940 [Mesoterricola sediminis]